MQILYHKLKKRQFICGDWSRPWQGNDLWRKLFAAPLIKGIEPLSKNVAGINAEELPRCDRCAFIQCANRRNNSFYRKDQWPPLYMCFEMCYHDTGR